MIQKNLLSAPSYCSQSGTNLENEGSPKTTKKDTYYAKNGTQSQLFTATLISSFIQSKISFRLFPSSVATFILIEVYYLVKCSIVIWLEFVSVIFLSCEKSINTVG